MLQRVFLFVFIGGACIHAAERENARKSPATSSGGLSWPNVPASTLGGKQFWSDVNVIRGWRIQRHAVTRHCRLLDQKGVRRAWGTFAACQAELDRMCQQLQWGPLPKHCVIVLHGLGRTRNSMQTMADHLVEAGGWGVENVGYASGRLSIDRHAENLALVIDGLKNQAPAQLKARASMGWDWDS